MVSMSTDALSALRRAHAERPGTVDLVLFLSHFPNLEDDELADLIELDARERLRAGMDVQLSRYLEAINDLPSRRVALDAAIEFSLRSLSGSRHTTVEAVQTLCECYPELVTAISAAWFLNDALGSTTGGSTMPQPQPELRLPMSVGPEIGPGKNRYELRERVGAGSHASVYLAVDHALSEPDRPAWVAVKVTSVMPGSTAVSIRIVEEATKARRVSHPNIARVLDRGTLGVGREFVVYEHVDAGDLQDAHDRGRLPSDHRELARLVSKIARAVQAAHSAGLIHSDLKPSNVLLNSSGEPKVADFGLAARRFDLDDTAKGGRVQLGTLGFMAPERYRAEPGSESVFSDVYSLGGILYFLLTGAPPNGSTPDEVADRLGANPETGKPPELRCPTGPVNADLCAICQRSLAPRAADRYPSADALANDLDAWLAHRPLAWRQTDPARGVWLFIRRNPVISATAVAVLLASVVGTAAVVNVMYSASQRTLRRELDIAKERSDDKLKYEEGTKQVVRSMIGIVETDRAKLSADWLPFVTVIESVTGPLLFDLQSPGADLGVIWSERIEFARGLIAAAEKDGRADDSNTMLWRVGLGFWLLRDGQYADARRTLVSVAQQWNSRFGPQDTWSMYSRTLAAAATIQDILKTVKDGALTTDDRAEVGRCTTQLATDLAGFKTDSDSQRVQRLALEALIAAYGPLLLNDETKKKDAEERLRRLGV